MADGTNKNDIVIDVEEIRVVFAAALAVETTHLITADNQFHTSSRNIPWTPLCFLQHILAKSSILIMPTKTEGLMYVKRINCTRNILWEVSSRVVVLLGQNEKQLSETLKCANTLLIFITSFCFSG